ncbi:MAG TPA: hypothetical protein VLI39_12635 [Sedimentisphaerales bacterium]|nr:hypothetical protein [Sedimentisphaerales bacterium]
MIQRERNQSDERGESGRALISRRAAIASSGAIALCAMSGGALGQEGGFSGLPKEIQERMAKSREFSERMRDAGSDEERTRIMEERNAWERARAIEDIRGQLEVAEAEWSVLKSRVEAVYKLVHPQPQFGGAGNMGPMSPVDRSRNELRQMLASKDASADQIKAKLTALRVVQEQSRQELTKARQNLRQLLTLRQEAALVLNGLLD